MEKGVELPSPKGGGVVVTVVHFIGREGISREGVLVIHDYRYL